MSAPRRPDRGPRQVDRGWESHDAAVTAVSWLHQLLHQLPLLKHRAVIQAEGLHPVPQGAAGVAVQHAGPVLLVHRHHLALHALRPRHRLPEAPGAPVIVAVEAESVRRGQAELTEALSAVDVVGVGRDEQASGLELDAVARAEREGGPLCADQRRTFQSLDRDETSA